MKSTTAKLIAMLVCVLLVPAIPFLVMGSWFEPWLETLLSSKSVDMDPAIAFSIVVGVLSGDILLPVPSSAVCTFAGKQLGALSGTAACWIGLNISAAIGYVLGNRFGIPVVKRFSDESTISRLQKFDQRSSVVCLVLCRGLPIIAEASVLLMGIRKLPWQVFWPPVLLAHH
jgi:uncharacterized membrane protein YdjX (TVP38/TMEM64 family)